MPILTKPTITKGAESTLTLDKSLIAALPMVSADAYFSDQLNWNKIVLSYQSDTGKQTKTVIFDATQATPTGKFSISLKARNVFNAVRIDIYDFDNGRFSIPVSSLNASEFNIDTTPPSFYIFNSLSAGSGLSQDLFGYVAKTSAGSTQRAKASTPTGMYSGNFSVEIETVNLQIGFPYLFTLSSTPFIGSDLTVGILIFQDGSTRFKQRDGSSTVIGTMIQGATDVYRMIFANGAASVLKNGIEIMAPTPLLSPIAEPLYPSIEMSLGGVNDFVNDGTSKIKFLTVN